MEWTYPATTAAALSATATSITTLGDFVLAECAEPVISGVNPNPISRAGGQSLTISGTGFADAGNSVIIGGNVVTVETESATSITITTPPNLCSGNITVTNACGQISNTYAYTVTDPFIANINPTILTAGSTITITGSNFASSGNVVTIGGVNITTFTSQDHTVIIGTVPAGTPCSGDVVVTICGQNSNDVAYTLQTPTTPLITATESTCQPGCTVSGGSFNITPCTGSTMTFYDDLIGTNPTTTAPTYHQTTPMTIYYACVDDVTGCRSAIQTLTTVPGSCTTPATPMVDVTAATCSSAGIATITNYDMDNTYTFDPVGPTAGAGGVVNNMMTGTTYTVTATNNSGCTSAVSSTFSIDAQLMMPSAPLAGSDSPVCEGGTLHLMASANGTTPFTYSWEGPDLFTSTDQNPEIAGVTSLTSGTYTVTVTNTCGSTNTSVVVVIKDAPFAVMATNDGPVCLGTTLNLHVTSGGTAPFTYEWEGPNMFTSVNQTPQVESVPLANSGTYTVTVTNSCGSSTSSTTAVVVGDPTISGITPSVFGRAGGETVTIYGFNFIGVYFVTLNGIIANHTVISPTEMEITTPANICSGDLVIVAGCGVSTDYAYIVTEPVIFDVSPAALTAGSTITITGSNFASSGNVVTIGGVNMTTFASQSHTQIVGTVPAGIPCSGDVVVTICGQSSNAVGYTSPNPGVTPGVSPAVCSGVLTANLAYSNPTENPTQYTLNFDVLAEAQGFVDVAYTSLPPSPIVISVPGGAIPDTYLATLRVRNAQGCESALYNITVTVNPLPTVTFTGTLATLCVSSTMYELTGGMPAGGVYSGPGVTGTNFDASVAGANTHTLQYSYTDINGCTNSATNSIVVLALPAAPTGDAIQEFCHNDQRRVSNLTATGSNILWYANATGGSSLGGSTSLVNGEDYFASQTVNGCESSDRFEVTVVIYARPTIEVDVTQPHVCLDATVVEMNFTVENGADTYSMDFDPVAEAAGFVDIVDAPLGTSPLEVNIPVNAPASLSPYSATITVSNSVTGCSNTSDVSYFYFFIDPDQTAGTSITGPNTLCIGAMATYYSNAEFPVGQGLFSTGNPTIATINPTTGELTALSDGMVSVIYTMSAGCGPVSTVSKNITVRANNTAGLASDEPTVCVNTLMPSITHTTTGATGRSTSMTGLPAGVTSFWSANVLTISGTPSVSGTFNYQILLTGGCGTTYATGTITVNPDNTASAASSTPTMCTGLALTPVTHTTTGATGISNDGISGANGLPTGVSASWAGDVITISGTPTVDGTFNYMIPLTGGCGNVYASGTITVILANAAGPASSTPTLCINTSMTDITHTTTGATGIGVATGLPTGVSATWTGDVITISGIPTESGAFSYSIPLTGGCGIANATGMITVNPDNTVGVGSSTPTLCINTSLTDITHTTTGATGVGSASGLPLGVNVSWSGDVITISGTPTESGVFSYNIPLTGGCGSVNATGMITVTPDNTASAASSTPALCINTLLTDITHTTTGATGISNDGVTGANGLPAGVSATWTANTITISGTPSASGTFNYSIPLTGGCGNVSATGTITVRALPTATISGTVEVLQFSPTAPVITFTGSGGTGPYTFYYSKQENSDPATFQWTSPSGNPVTVAQTNAIPGVFAYTLLRVADVYGCEYELPAVQPTAVVTVLMSSDMAPGMPRPINGAFVNGEVKEGVLQLTNAGPGPTVGQLTFRISNLVNFDINIPSLSGTYGGLVCQNSVFTIVPGPFFTTITTNASIPVGGNLRLGFIATATGFGGANGTLTTTILNGNGRDYNNTNNKTVRTFVIN